MHDIIKKLKEYEANQLDDWYDLDEKISEQFIADVAEFARENEAEIVEYCQNLLPSEFSTLSIVYEALSRDSTRWNHFLFDEIVRVIELVKQKKIPIQALGVLSEIDAENIYKELPVYIEVINYLVSELDLKNSNRFNIALLDLLDWYLMEIFINDEIAEVNDWYIAIKDVYNHSVDLNVKRVALDAMRHLEDYNNVKRSSVIQSLRDFFDQNSSLS